MRLTAESTLDPKIKYIRTIFYSLFLLSYQILFKFIPIQAALRKTDKANMLPLHESVKKSSNLSVGLEITVPYRTRQ